MFENHELTAVKIPQFAGEKQARGMSPTSLNGNGKIVDDIRGCRDGLVSMRADYVQAFAVGENGPFAWKELSQLQSIIMAFDAVIEEANSLRASAVPESRLEAAIEDVKRVTALRQQGRI